VLIGETWYLIGYCYTRQRVLEFAVSRVRGVRPTPQTFAPPEGFDLQKYLAGSFRGWRGEGHHRVVLRFPPAVAGRAAEKMWHASQTTELEAGGSLRMTLELSDLQEVMRWVLSWGAECEVLEPAELRTMVMEELRRIGQAYAEGRRSVVRSQ
jgi:predicted DNA-binding transcriptional regulator YafY